MGLIQQLLRVAIIVYLTYPGVETFDCYGDICTRGQYCDMNDRRCAKCSLKLCHSTFANCSQYCEDEQEKLINKTVARELEKLRVQSCTPVDVVPHGSYAATGYDHNDTVTFTCDPGYIREDGPSTIWCGDFGQWSSQPPKCARTDTSCWRGVCTITTLVGVIIGAIPFIICWVRECRRNRSITKNTSNSSSHNVNIENGSQHCSETRDTETKVEASAIGSTEHGDNGPISSGGEENYYTEGKNEEAATSTNSIGHVVAIQLTTITNIENEKMTDLPGSENKPQDKDKNDQDKNDNSHAPVQETSTKDQPKNASQSQDTMVKHTEPEDGEDESSRLLTTTEPPQSDTDTQTMNIALRENLMKRKGDHIV